MEHDTSKIENQKNTQDFSEKLYQRMQQINSGIEDLELFEFRYALENLIPKEGWNSVQLQSVCEIEEKIHARKFYESIQLRPRIDEKLVFDVQLTQMTQMLFLGIVENVYSIDWVNKNFYFDLRAFYFFHRTNYYNEKIIKHLGEHPYRSFEREQYKFKRNFDIGYQAFMQANERVDQCLNDLLFKLISTGHRPCIIGIAGQTGAGKTEIVAQLQKQFSNHNLSFTSLEMDHFLTDRDEREEKGIDSLGKEALHFELFRQSLKLIRDGLKITIPQYDFISATSSHSIGGILKPGHSSGEVQTADIIFVEGNFPFLYDEIAELIDIKVVYITDDEIRLKRKWKRDMDLRKKYDLTYFINRYFREQFLMAESAYIPQMEKCDVLVDTTEASIWMNTKISKILDAENLLVEPNKS